MKGLGKNRWLFLGFVLVLVVLYLLSSTNLILHDKKTEIYPISVIVEKTSDEDYEKLRKGMDRAAEEFHVDLSFITLYEPNDQNQQLQLISREISDGARAVILSPANPVEAGIGLETMVLNSPLIILGNMLPARQVKVGISIDYQEAGRLLGEAARENSSALPVYVLTEGLEYGYAREIYDGVCQVLEKIGCVPVLHTIRSPEDCRRLIESTVYPQKQAAVLIALDEESLERAAGIMEDSTVYAENIRALYGIGGTTRLLNYLDKGIIRGMAVHNWFDEGYLSIEKAVSAIQGESWEKEEITMEVYYITREDLRKPAYEKMLYPID